MLKLFLVTYDDAADDTYAYAKYFAADSLETATEAAKAYGKLDKNLGKITSIEMLGGVLVVGK
jgi:hypothetical protein